MARSELLNHFLENTILLLKFAIVVLHNSLGFSGMRFFLKIFAGAPGVTRSLDDGDDTKARKVTISGLTMAGIYQFPIRALGELGYTDWMDPKDLRRRLSAAAGEIKKRGQSPQRNSLRLCGDCPHFFLEHEPSSHKELA